MTTEILDAAIANAAIFGDIFPDIAIGIIAVLYMKAKNRF